MNFTDTLFIENYLKPLAISDLTETVIAAFAGTVKIPEAALKLILPEETDAESVNLTAPLYK